MGLRTSYFLIFLVAAVSCEQLDKEEIIPAFINVNSVNVDVREPGDPDFVQNEGSASSNIKDAWLFVNDNLVGVFELPFLVPVTQEGIQSVKLIAGIQRNGISADRIQYPFYDLYETSLDLVPEMTFEINPVVKYFNTSLSFWIEDFEDPGVKLEPASNSDTTLERTFNTNFVFEGTASGIIDVDPINSYFKLSTIADLEIEIGREAFLEMNYSNTIPLTIGLKAEGQNSAEISLVGLNPTSDNLNEPVWNKVYIDLKNGVGNLGNAESYEVLLLGNSFGAEGRVLLDNIKIIHSE